jgi:hypothetical protein
MDEIFYWGFASWTVHFVNNGCVVSSDVLRTAHHIHNILSTAPQLSISQKTLGKLPDDGNVMPNHVGATVHN